MLFTTDRLLFFAGHLCDHFYQFTNVFGNGIQCQFNTKFIFAGYRQLISRAPATGIRVIGSPIGPYKGASYWTEEGEAARQKINTWILTSGAFDGIVRLDEAFANPADKAAMRDGYHMGDFLHGSDAGLKAVGESIDLALFKTE